jgi:outer membrane receptor protein involved in Fe transport
VGGYLDDLTFISTVGADPDQDRGERFSPRYIANVDLTWTNGPYTLNYGLSWFSKTRRFTTEQLTANPDLSDPRFFFRKERWEHDAQLAINVNERFSFYGGVNNFTDEKPAVATTSYPVSDVGRFFYMGAKVKLGGLPKIF